jgi:hypothetical protein
VTRPVVTISITGNLQTPNYLDFIIADDWQPSGGTEESLVLYSAARDITCTLTGTGFEYDLDGNLTAGTIQNILSVGATGATVEVSGAQFAATDFIRAASGDTIILSEMLSDYGVIFDARESGAGIGAMFTDFQGGRMIMGSAYADILQIDTAATNTVFGGKGDDQIVVFGNLSGGLQEAGSFHGGGGNDDIFGYWVQNSRFLGGTGNDRVIAVGGSNVSHGGAGDDILLTAQFDPAGRSAQFGGAGADILYGVGNGRVTQYGGAGADQFVFEVVQSNSQRLTIGDFNPAEDTLVFFASQFAPDATADDVVSTYGRFNGQGFVQLLVNDHLVTLRGITSLEDAAGAIRFVGDDYLDGLLVG